MKKIKDLINYAFSNNRIPRLLVLALGCFIISLVYNAFTAPNHIVAGSIGGIAIIVENLLGISNITVLNVVIGFSIVLSWFMLGKKNTLYSIVGYLMYILMINLTLPIAKYFQFSFDSKLFTICFYSVISGIGSGFIYRTGFNTGGMDIFITLIQNVVKKPFSTISTIVNGIIILVGAFIFSPVDAIYGFIMLYITNYVCNLVLIGTSANKLCFIKCHDHHDVLKYLHDDMKVGSTLINSTNGIGILKRTIIMCVVPTDRFLTLKRKVLEIDKKATIYSNDCYTVVGGKTNLFIPV